MLIRRETRGDQAAVRRVHALAFATADGQEPPAEVTLVERLRSSTAWLPRLALVATAGEEVVGHVVCSRAWVGAARHAVLGLGPVAVHPDRQGRGVGSALLHAALGAAEACDEPLVGLVGAPDFYRRFGFVPAADLGIDPPDRSWGAYFQVRVLWAYTPELRGPFRYAAPFDDV
jgi:putative acetyltransferase